MERVVTVPKNAMDAALQIVEEGEGRHVMLRLLGGLAFKLTCPTASVEKYRRENKDIDLVGRKSDSGKVSRLMEELGYKPREMFNRLSMGQRLIYYDMANRRRVDIFLDQFAMCHKFDFSDRLLPGLKTLPFTDLVMTKLQVVEITEKEFLDLIAAFADHEVTKGEIDGELIAEACAKDWGLYKTFSRNLDALSKRAQGLDEPLRDRVLSRIDTVNTLMENEPKTLGWRVRARIGEKARWYELPDSDSDAVFS